MRRLAPRRRMGLAFLAVLVSVVPVQAGLAGAAVDQTAASRDLGSLEDWPTWQHDLLGTRFNPFERRITADNVANLKLKWSYVLPNPDEANAGQPAVVGDTLYVGGRDAKLYAIDAKTGATKWTYDVTAVAGPTDPQNLDQLRDGPAVSGTHVVFGDTRAWIYSVNKNTGKLEWATRVSDHPHAIITSSPLIYRGRVYVGVSSNEEVASANPTYPCCTARGQLVALDVGTGAVSWRYYTVPPPVQTGTSPNGTPEYGPSGVSVWSSPVADPTTDTVYFTTSNNYTGDEGDSDSILAVDPATGAVKWKQQMTHPDKWTVGCAVPGQPHCPGIGDGTNLDFDIGASPNLFRVGDRTLVGFGQKSGVYHALDARNGDIVWQQQVAVPTPNGGESGIQWGTSYDGSKIYVATHQAQPGTLFALDPATGHILWNQPNPADGCSTGGAAAFPDLCSLSLMPAVSASPGVVWEGSRDGKIRAYRSTDGAILWQYDTIQQYTGVNGLTGSGGSLAGNGGAVISHGMLYVLSGTTHFWGIPGRVLLAFGVDCS